MLYLGIAVHVVEDSEGKRIFLEFAAEEREHLRLLIGEYRKLVGRSRSADGSSSP